MKNIIYYKFNCYVLVIVLILSIIPMASAQWITQNSGTTWSLLSVHFLNSDTGYVCGECGTILKTTDGGANWQSLSSGVFNMFEAIFFTDANTGYVFGTAGLILKTTDAGNSWSNLNFSGNVSLFSSAHFTNERTGYAVGHEMVGSNMKARIAKTTDAGISWTIQAFDSITNLNSIYFPDAKTGYIVGNTNYVGGTILKTTDGGNSWYSQVSGTRQSLASVYFTNANTGYAVGETILKTTNGGTDWIALNPETNGWFYSIHFPGASTGYAVSGWPGDGGIFKTTNAGESWSFQDPGTTESLNKVFFVDDNIGYIVGDRGVILKTVNGGGVTSIKEKKDIIPGAFRLGQNYPNPFNSSTTIQFSLPKLSFAILKVYNALGKEVATLVSKNMEAGTHQVEWDASGLSSGAYFYKLQAGSDLIERKKMLLLR